MGSLKAVRANLPKVGYESGVSEMKIRNAEKIVFDQIILKVGLWIFAYMYIFAILEDPATQKYNSWKIKEIDMSLNSPNFVQSLF